MDKNGFLNGINYEDKIAVSNIFEKIILCEKSGRTTFSSEFYPPVVWSSIDKLKSKLGCKFFSSGVFEEGERRVIAFTDTFTEEEEIVYPIELLKITNRSKFDKLEHKDYLGALMALGIKREKYGDLIALEECCYLPVYEDVADYVIEKLEQIGRAPCYVEKIDTGFENIPQYRFEEKTVIATSLRIDSVTASLANVSRADAVELIDESKVSVDYEIINDKAFTIKLPATISIRKCGKFVIKEVAGETQKGRIKILIKKFI